MNYETFETLDDDELCAYVDKLAEREVGDYTDNELRNYVLDDLRAKYDSAPLQYLYHELKERGLI